MEQLNGASSKTVVYVTAAEFKNRTNPTTLSSRVVRTSPHRDTILADFSVRIEPAHRKQAGKRKKLFCHLFLPIKCNKLWLRQNFRFKSRLIHEFNTTHWPWNNCEFFFFLLSVLYSQDGLPELLRLLQSKNRRLNHRHFLSGKLIWPCNRRPKNSIRDVFFFFFIADFYFIFTDHVDSACCTTR